MAHGDSAQLMGIAHVHVVRFTRQILAAILRTCQYPPAYWYCLPTPPVRAMILWPGSAILPSNWLLLPQIAPHTRYPL
jgi:hypothetical protein